MNPYSILQLIRSEKFEELLKYDHFDFTYLTENDSISILFTCINENVIQHVLDHAVNLEHCDQWNRRPIHYACLCGNVPIVRRLINKVDLECEDNWKTKPIHYACEVGNQEIVKMLFESDVEKEPFDYSDMSPLHYACQSGSLDLVKYLVDSGLNIDIEDIDDNLPIDHARESGNIEIIDFLENNQLI